MGHLLCRFGFKYPIPVRLYLVRGVVRVCEHGTPQQRDGVGLLVGVIQEKNGTL
jgi:hypothetical protein